MTNDDIAIKSPRDTPANRRALAQGDPRGRYGVDLFAAEAQRQRELREMIPPGGRRALYLDHLHTLAEETGTLLAFHHPRGFVANWRAETTFLPGLAPRIETPLPLTASHYLTGLHEFGHVCQPDLGGTSNHGATPEGIYGELMAAVWAFEHSLVPIPRSDYSHAQYTPLFEARRLGWTDGPVEEVLPVHLRVPFRDGLARLAQAAGQS